MSSSLHVQQEVERARDWLKQAGERGQLPRATDLRPTNVNTHLTEKRVCVCVCVRYGCTTVQTHQQLCRQLRMNGEFLYQNPTGAAASQLSNNTQHAVTSPPGSGAFGG